MTRAICPPAWTELALCAQADAEAWFPEQGGPTRRVKAICRRCPARVPCLGYALDRAEQHGIWAGLSPEERHVAAPAYARGASLEAVIAAADASREARQAAASEHARITAAIASAAAARAAKAEKAAFRAASDPPYQPPQEAAA